MQDTPKWGYDNHQACFSAKHIQLKKESDYSVYKTKGKVWKLISREGNYSCETMRMTTSS